MLSSTSSDSASTAVESRDKYSFVLLLPKISANATHHVFFSKWKQHPMCKRHFLSDNNNKNKKRRP